MAESFRLSPVHYPPKPPGRVTAAAVIVYIGAVLGAIGGVLFLYLSVRVDAPPYRGVLALLGGFYIVTAAGLGFVARRARNGSRRARNVLILLCAADIVLDIVRFTGVFSVLGIAFHIWIIGLIGPNREAIRYYENVARIRNG